MTTTEVLYPREVPKNIPENLTPTQLRERSLKTEIVKGVDSGGIVVKTRPTGRTPQAKGIVVSAATEDKVSFGNVNREVSAENFAQLKDMQSKRLQRSGDVYRNDYFVQFVNRVVPVRLTTSSAWSSLFASNLFLTNQQRQEAGLKIDDEYSISITHTPSEGQPEKPRVWTDFAENGIIDIRISDTEYAGEIKKSVFNAMNFITPDKNILSLHCGADVDENGVPTLYLGLSGTGKTTLSSNPERFLLGDDEHIWSDDGVNNIEGGCYAKLKGLREDKEPRIFKGIFNELAILENVDLDSEGKPIFSQGEENMRGAYSLKAVDGVYPHRIAGHPKNIIFLTADALGGMPMLAKLTPQQAIYHFLSGYTSKIPGTEAGIKEPETTFSACFGEPFLPRDPLVYARLLSQKIQRHGSNVYLVNTGWQGGYSANGRTPLEFSRACVSAIQNGALEGVSFNKDGLGFYTPARVPGIPEDMLDPQNAFPTRDDYRRATKVLASAFSENFEAKFSGRLTGEVINSAPVAQIS